MNSRKPRGKDDMSRGSAGDQIAAIAAQFGAELKDPRKPFTLLVRFRVKEGMEENVEAAFAAASTATRKEKGVMAFDLNREAKDATRFVVYERWKSLAHLEAHLRTPYIATLRDELEEMLAGLAEFHVLVPAGE